MIRQVDLLVHAGAPSGRGDDERYRSQATAYLQHEAWSSRPLAQPSNYRPSRSAKDLAEPDDIARDPPAAMNVRQPLYLDDTQLAFSALESQLLTSSLPDLSTWLAPQPLRQDSAPADTSPSQPQISRAVAASSRHDGDILDVSLRRGVLLNDMQSDGSNNDDPLEAQSPVSLKIDHAHTRATPINASDQQSWSSYLVSPILDRAVKRRRVDQDVHGPDTRRPFSSPRSRTGTTRVAALAAVVDPSAFPPIPIARLTRSLEESSSNGTSSQLPTSYSLSVITTESSTERAHVSQRSASDPGPQNSSHHSREGIPAFLSDNAAITGKGNSTDHNVTDDVSTVVERSDSTGSPHKNDSTGQHRKLYADANSWDIGPMHARPAEQQCHVDLTGPTPSQDAEPSSTLSMTIHPPTPEVGIAKFTTHVTDSLRCLVEHPDLAICYRPVSVKRDLKALERGYWLINCASWPVQTRSQFWQDLGKAIKAGSAGWGVWCSRSDAVSNDQSFGEVKVFCWGEVVKHVYLMLYTFSQSKVRKLGLQWIDAEGDVVVQMRQA